MDALVAQLGDEIRDVDEETFELFSQPSSLENLGMLDPKAAILDLNIAGRDFEITQSPGLLQSNRQGGTTGAAVWQSTVRFAEWLESPSNLLFTSGLLRSSSIVLELGAGISGIIPSVLGQKVRKVISTDQAYTLKALQSNITSNFQTTGKSKKTKASELLRYQVLPLDWEGDDATSFLRSNGLSSGVDVIVACDCIYNYALIEPLAQTCADLCRARRAAARAAGEPGTPTACVFVQQLRQAQVFELWIAAFIQAFRVWRVPTNQLSSGLRDNSGFAVHIAILRENPSDMRA